MTDSPLKKRWAGALGAQRPNARTSDGLNQRGFANHTCPPAHVWGEFPQAAQPGFWKSDGLLGYMVVAAVINKTLAKNPHQRYQSGEQMARAIRRCLATPAPAYRFAAAAT